MGLTMKNNQVKIPIELDQFKKEIENLKNDALAKPQFKGEYNGITVLVDSHNNITAGSWGGRRKPWGVIKGAIDFLFLASKHSNLANQIAGIRRKISTQNARNARKYSAEQNEAMLSIVTEERSKNPGDYWLNAWQRVDSELHLNFNEPESFKKYIQRLIKKRSS